MLNVTRLLLLYVCFVPLVYTCNIILCPPLQGSVLSHVCFYVPAQMQLSHMNKFGLFTSH